MNIRNKLHDIKLNNIFRCCEGKIKENIKIIDIGCWDAYITSKIQQYFNCDIYCTDIIDKRKYCIPFKLITNSKLPYKNKEFDIALLIDTLHHVKKEKQLNLIREVERIANKVFIFESGGLFGYCIDIILSSFNRMSNPLSLRSFEEWYKLLPYYTCTKIKVPFYYLASQYFFELKKDEMPTLKGG